MPYVVTEYVDPGVYDGEEVIPGASNISTQPAVLGIVAPGSRVKQVTNERITRGMVSGDALAFEVESGTGDSISAPSGGEQTLTDAAGAFATLVVGGKVTIRGASNAVNNGTFPITARPSATSITYTNPAGVVEASFTGTYAVKPFAVIGDTVPVSGSSPVRTLRKLEYTTVYRDGKALSDSQVSFRAAHVEAAVSEPVDLTTGGLTTPAIVVEMDGKVPLTVIFTTGAGATTVIGTEVTVGESATTGLTDLANATRAQIVAALNEALNPTDSTANAAVTALGYGAAYGSAASEIASYGIRLASPISTSSSQVRLSSAIDEDALALIFGSASVLNRESVSVLEMSPLVYNASSVYTVDYVDLDDTEDALEVSDVQTLVRIGSSGGISTYEESVDYALGTDVVDWSLDTAAVVTGVGVAASFALSTHDTFALSVDGKVAVDLDVVGSAVAPTLGYVTIGVPATAAIASVADNINALLASNANYGARYGSVASVLIVNGVSYLQLTSPTTGPGSSIELSVPSTSPTNDATTALWGSLQSAVVGTGKKPALGADYFVTYTVTRPASDYAVTRRWVKDTTALADLGTPNASNPLAVATYLAFKQRLTQLVTVQVNDATLPGSPTRAEYQAALAAFERSDLATEVWVESTDLAVQLDLKDHIESETSPTKKHYRRGWFGLARGAEPGDRDTPDSYVYRATRTLQVTPDSPARGRLFLVAPHQLSGATIDLTQDDGTVERVELTGAHMALMAAAKRCALANPSASLAFQNLIGLNVDDVDLSQVWSPPERKQMASNGVSVVTYDAGNFYIMDPVSTEGGGASVAKFLYDNTSPQKDNITRKIDRALSRALIGLVPIDLYDFVLSIKVIIGDVIQGEIPHSLGAYKNSDGTPRRIDITVDVDAYQSDTDPTKFFYEYTYNLKYPALRMFGTHSVDNPFAARS